MLFFTDISPLAVGACFACEQVRLWPQHYLKTSTEFVLPPTTKSWYFLGGGMSLPRHAFPISFSLHQTGVSASALGPLTPTPLIALSASHAQQDIIAGKDRRCNAQIILTRTALARARANNVPRDLMSWESTTIAMVTSNYKYATQKS